MALFGSGPRALQDGRGCHPQPRPLTPLHLHTRAPAPECSPSEFLSRFPYPVGPAPKGWGAWAGWAGEQEACRVGSCEVPLGGAAA